MCEQIARDRAAQATPERRPSIVTIAVIALALSYCASMWAGYARSADVFRGLGIGRLLLQLAPGFGLLVIIGVRSRSTLHRGILTGAAALGTTLYLSHWKWVHLSHGRCMKRFACTAGPFLWPTVFVLFWVVVAVVAALWRRNGQARRGDG